MSSVLLVATLALALSAVGSPTPDTSSKNIILRKLAEPRFFGAAANTTFLFNDVNYTKVISTQVSRFFHTHKLETCLIRN